MIYGQQLVSQPVSQRVDQPAEWTASRTSTAYTIPCVSAINAGIILIRSILDPRSPSSLPLAINFSLQGPERETQEKEKGEAYRGKIRRDGAEKVQRSRGWGERRGISY